MGNLRLQNELNDLRSRYKVRLDDLTADEIAELVDCCRKVDDPFGGAGVALSDLPVACIKGVPIYPLTVGASIWLDEYVAEWWGKDNTCYFWALVFAMIHAHEKDVFAQLTDRGKARRRILATCLRFMFDRRTLEQAVDRALGAPSDDGDRKRNETESHNDWVAFLARLETQTGIHRDEWLWGRSAAYTIRAYRDLHAFAARYAAIGDRVRIFDAMDRALNALARLKKRIKVRLESRSEEAEPSAPADSADAGGDGE